jgi:hypothetical protein
MDLWPLPRLLELALYVSPLVIVAVWLGAAAWLDHRRRRSSG